MKISAIVGVKDEESLVEQCINHLFAIGVDHVIVEDYGSSDGTQQIVRQYPADILTAILFDESRDMSVTSWGQHEARIATSTGADWVIFLDADEFWLPLSGSIRPTLSAITNDVITIDRFNVPVNANGPFLPQNLSVDNYDKVMLYVEKIGNIRKELQDSTARSWISSVPVAKIAVRPSVVSALGAGHHKAAGYDGKWYPNVTTSDVIIAHVPFTTFDRFQSKLVNIRESISLQPSYHTGSTAWHWKRWIDLDDSGELRREFQRQLLDADQFRRQCESGWIKSAKQFFNENQLKNAGI